MSNTNSFNSENTSLTLDLPDWAVEEMNALPEYLRSREERMAAVIRFARLNFQRKTGGPFAAGIFERDSGKLVVIGVNRVVPFHCSSAHAEIMAISLAQKRLGNYDLGAGSLPAHQIVINWSPCAMCFGAILWSGVRSVMIAGAGPELENITGFDEGPLHPRWHHELQTRGIELVENVLHQEAVNVFEEFSASNQLVYNARLGTQE